MVLGKGSLKEKASVILTSLSLSTGVFAPDTLVTETLLAEGTFFLKVKPLKKNRKTELDGLILTNPEGIQNSDFFLLIYIIT